MDTKDRYLPQLDGLRALACAVVVFHHIPTQLGVGGYIGVDVFFVLSGFLITRILRSESARTGTIALKDFYGRRLRRLTPALVLCVLFVVQMYLVIPIAPNKNETALGGLLTVTYTGSWAKAFGWANLGWLAHAWSLSVEEHFYLLWPLVVRWSRARLRTLLLATGALFTASSAWWYLGVARGWSTDRLVFAPDTRAKDLLAGCLLALLVEHGLSTRDASTRRGASRGVTMPWAPSVAGGTSLAVLATWSFVVPKESMLYLAGWPVVIGAAVVLVWALAVDTASALSRGLSQKGLVWLGQRSYGIYLWHYPMTVANAAVVHWSAPSRALVAAGTTTTATVLAAWSYRFVEQPLRHRAYGPLSLAPLRDMMRRLGRRRPVPAPSWPAYGSGVPVSAHKPLGRGPSHR